MSNVQMFRASSTHEAYALVRKAFGKDAIILRTNRRRLGWWPWKRHSLVEVEAMCDEDASTVDAPSPEDEARLRDQARIARLEQMISQITTKSTHDADAIPKELFQTFTQLLDAGVEHADARELIVNISHDRDAVLDGNVAHAAIKDAVQASLQCHGPIQCRKGTRRIAALIGPTGVGKTTTIAKLASGFHLNDGLRVGLITTDTFRSAAVDQLRTYALALGLPLEVAGNAEELHAALARLNDRELVLIDTAGRSPRDEPRLAELKSMLRGCPIDEIHLVLSLTTSPRGLSDLADHFRPLAPTALLLTKLDEAAGPGTAYSAARRVSTGISYITTGQAVPDDIEVADARRIANTLLRDEPVRLSRGHQAAPREQSQSEAFQT